MTGVRRWWLPGLLGLLLLALGGIAPALGLASLPPGYQVLRQFGKPCRIDLRRLPWRVASSDPGMARFVAQATQVWNAEGVRLGIGPFFVPVPPDTPPELVIDWSGNGLPPDKAGGVYWDANLGYRRVLRLVMDGDHRLPEGNRTQILLQELGHVLGLSDSGDRGDTMYPIMATRRLYRVDGARLSQRDSAALAWLYQQSEWVPILAPDQIFQPRLPAPAEPEEAPLTPEGLFTPQPVP